MTIEEENKMLRQAIIRANSALLAYEGIGLTYFMCDQESVKLAAFIRNIVDENKKVLSND